VTQFVSLLVILFLFLSPVFYPVSALPEQFRFLLQLNPLTLPIESGRLVLIVGRQPDWLGLLMQTALGAAVAYIGFWWFQRTRKGFADVV
jgi:lipopolysaccharide transport system permease protein